MNPNFAAFLESSVFIDWQHPEVLQMATDLAKGCRNAEEVAKNCFLFVRDQIKHSWDFELNPVTCKASEVLEHGTGYCYAKSHLLAALLRANQIPAGLCYQRLTITDKPPFCLHGLNAVYFEPYGWYRMDARGNKKGVTSEFCPPVEKLAFQLVHVGEADFPEVYSAPLAVVTEVLTNSATYLEVAKNLPDAVSLAPSANKT